MACSRANFTFLPLPHRLPHATSATPICVKCGVKPLRVVELSMREFRETRRPEGSTVLMAVRVFVGKQKVIQNRCGQLDGLREPSFKA